MTEYNSSNQRSSFEIKKGLLMKAFKENRGAEMIAKILEHCRRIKALCPESDKKIMHDFLMVNTGQPRALRALNWNNQLDGKQERYYDRDILNARRAELN